MFFRGQLAANITKATKFSDLSESDQKLIVDIEYPLIEEIFCKIILINTI